MHEYSIVQSLLDSCEDVCKNNNASRAIKIYIQIGEFSGVEPELLKIAFHTFKEQSIFAAGADLDVDFKKDSDEMLLLRLELE